MSTIPGYIKYFTILSSLILTIFILIWAQAILSPVFAAFIAALLLKPLSSLLERTRLSRGFSSILSIIIVLVLILGLFFFFSVQINQIIKDLDEIRTRLGEIINQIFNWINQTFGLEEQDQVRYLREGITSFLENSTAAITQTLSATADFFAAFFLFLIALFFILYYRTFFVQFIYKCFSREKHGTVQSTIHKVEEVVRSYILGLLIVIIIIAILNTVGLMILGIEHAIFFGVLAAVLTVIPYIGIFIGSLLPILFAFFTKDSLWYPLGVTALFWFVQFTEGNFITPNIIGGRVSINPFAAIIALFLGSMIWGIMGMILSIPFLAIIKVISDAVKPWQPVGFLLGNPPEEK